MDILDITIFMSLLSASMGVYFFTHGSIKTTKYILKQCEHEAKKYNHIKIANLMGCYCVFRAFLILGLGLFIYFDALNLWLAFGIYVVHYIITATLVEIYVRRGRGYRDD